MIKRLLRRIKERRLKRTTFMKMFLKAMILPVIVTVILGKIFPVMIRMSALEHSCRQMQEYSYGLERRIANVYLGKLPFQYFMCYTGDIDVRIEGGRLVPSTWIEPSGYSVSFTFDENGRILHSNRAKMFVFVNYGKQPEKYSEQYKTPEYDQLYTFDPLEHDIPELNSLFDDHFKEKKDEFYYSVITPYKGALEMWYIEHKSVGMYFRLIGLTIKAVLKPGDDSWKKLPDLPEMPEGLKPYL